MSKITPEFFAKAWGYEYTICNTDKYCGKKLVMAKGQKTSSHYYKIKDKTYFVNSGKIEIVYSEPGEERNLFSKRYIIIDEGEAFHVPSGMFHKVRALETTDLLSK